MGENHCVLMLLSMLFNQKNWSYWPKKENNLIQKVCLPKENTKIIGKTPRVKEMTSLRPRNVSLVTKRDI